MKKRLMFITLYIFLGLLIASCGGGGGGGGSVAIHPGNVSHVPGGIERPKHENPAVNPGDEHPSGGDHGSSGESGSDSSSDSEGGSSQDGGYDSSGTGHEGAQNGGDSGSGFSDSSGSGSSQGGDHHVPGIGDGQSQGGGSQHGGTGSTGESDTDESHNNYDNLLNLSRTSFKYIDNQQLPNIPRPVNRPEYIIGVMDADFITFKNELKNRYKIEIIEDLPKEINYVNGADHGNYVIKVINLDGDENFKIVAGSLGNRIYSEEDTIKSIRPSAKVYSTVIRFFGDQKVKIFNNSWGANYDDNNYPTINSRNFKTFLMSDNDKDLVKFYKDAVNNEGGLFIWAAGNWDKIKVNGKNQKVQYSNATIFASMPKYVPELEKGWISVVGAVNQQYERDYGHFAYAGDVKRWSIAANGDFTINEPGGSKAYRGSSFAAPLVARAAGLVATKFPWMSASQVRDVILTTGDDTRKINYNDSEEVRDRDENRYLEMEPERKYGWGYLNTARALKGPGRFLNTLLAVDSTNKVDGKNYFQARIPAGDTYFENNIYGDAGIYKTGEGKLHLMGKNHYTGDTVVKEGELHVYKVHSSQNTSIESGGKLVLHDKGYIAQVDSDDYILKGAGNVENRGEFELDGTVGTIGGNYSSIDGGITKIHLNSKLRVLGEVSIGENDTLRVETSNDYIGKRIEVPVIEAESVTNAPHVMSAPIFDSRATTDGKNITVTLERKNLKDYVKTEDKSSLNTLENIEGVLAELDSKLETGTLSESDKLRGKTLETMSAGAIEDASKFISGEVYASTQALTFAQSRDINRTLSNRMLTSDGEGWQSWMQGMGSYGRIDKSGYARAKTHVVGGQFGLDRKVGNNARAGVAIDYSYGDADFNRFAGDAKSDNVGVSLYGKKSFEDRSYIAGRAGISRITSKVKREILDSSLSGVKGDIKHHDTMLSLYAEFGKTFGYFTPYLGYSYDNLRRGSFSESNAAWGINADKKTYTANRVVLGLRGEYSGEDYRVNGYVSHEINVGNRDLGFDGHFTGSDVMLRFKGIDLARHTTWLGVGAEKDISPSVAITGNLDFLFENGKSWNSIASVGLKYSF